MKKNDNSETQLTTQQVSSIRRVKTRGWGGGNVTARVCINNRRNFGKEISELLS